MTTKENEKRAKKGEKVKLAITDANEQMRRMQEAVAHRAYAIFGLPRIGDRSQSAVTRRTVLRQPNQEGHGIGAVRQNLQGRENLPEMMGTTRGHFTFRGSGPRPCAHGPPAITSRRKNLKRADYSYERRKSYSPTGMLER
jgi:hypothetical protein